MSADRVHRSVAKARWCAGVFRLRRAHSCEILRTRARRILEYDLFYSVWNEIRPRRILSIGVAGYTAHYPLLFPSSAFATIDIDGKRAQWGSPFQHVVGDATILGSFWPSAAFDAVICNGVYGWGVDTEAGLRLLLAGIRDVLAPGGFLLFGWNVTQERDPLCLETRCEQVFEGFAPSRLGGREHARVRSEINHLYRFFAQAMKP